MIVVRDLTKLYGDFPAVRSISFAVAPGEVLGLVGPNGAGKTTTLRCLAGIIRPTGGTVAIAGHDMRRDAIAAKRELAFIPDEPHLFDYLSVEEHLRFIGRLYGVADVEARMPTLLDELELSEKRRALPGELSRGMRQKLAIACGLLHDPSALILDEPLTGLDPGGMRRMRATIAARAAQGTAVILSSHLLNLVEELCTKLLVVRRGECVALGTIGDIIAARPELAGRSLEDVFLALTSETMPSRIGEAHPLGTESAAAVASSTAFEAILYPSPDMSLDVGPEAFADECSGTTPAVIQELSSNVVPYPSADMSLDVGPDDASPAEPPAEPFAELPPESPPEPPSGAPPVT